MRKILIGLSIIISILVLNKDTSVVIPENAIRFRVIASSNSIADQFIKNEVAIDLENYLATLTKDDRTSAEANQTFLINYNNINNHINSFMISKNIKQKYTLNIGKNYFPIKEYKGIKYEPGYYDSVVVKLGSASGLNWWCVIYPPLCLLDENATNAKYTTLASELLHSL